MCMSKLTDKLIMLIICAALYLQNEHGIYVAVPVIYAVGVSALLSCFENVLIPLIFIAYSTACIIDPPLIYFFPLIGYDLVSTRWRIAIAAAVVPLLASLDKLPATALVFTALYLGLAYLLNRRTADLLKSKAEYFSLRNSAREFALQLEAKNKELMEKQDYEINLATLNERNRIARDIHDSIGHLLSNAILQIGALMAICKDEDYRAKLDTLKATLTQGMDSIRASIHDLHDESIDLYTEVKNITSNFQFCTLELDYDIEGNPNTKIKYALIAIIKEALSNIIKHSDATRANITLREHPAFYQLVIKDNGRPGKIAEAGIGLKNIVQRVENLNGRVNIDSSSGFMVFAAIPKEGHNDANSHSG